MRCGLLTQRYASAAPALYICRKRRPLPPVHASERERMLAHACLRAPVCGHAGLQEQRVCLEAYIVMAYIGMACKNSDYSLYSYGLQEQ